LADEKMLSPIPSTRDKAAFFWFVFWAIKNRADVLLVKNLF